MTEQSIIPQISNLENQLVYLVYLQIIVEGFPHRNMSDPKAASPQKVPIPACMKTSL